MRNLQSIEFQFENCEYFSIDAKYIGAFYVGDISHEVSRIACNAICDMDVAHEFCAEIYEEGNDTYSSWGDNLDKFNRILSYDDITSVTLKYDNGSEEELYLDYKVAAGEEDMLGANNVNQSSKKSKLGNLYIVVHSYKTVDSEFPDSEIKDADKIDFEKEMIGVNDPEPFTETEATNAK